MLRARAALPDAARQEIAQGIYAQLLTEPAFLNSRVIFIYCSTAEEISTDALIAYCLTAGKTVCVPRCVAKGEMVAHTIGALSELEAGSYGIREPGSCCPQISPREIDVVLAPCLCADRHGYRLGYGGGYYDRFLAQTSARVIALCAHARLFPDIPRQAHDRRCHKIVTEREVVSIDEK